jgi:hypothetical protein
MSEDTAKYCFWVNSSDGTATLAPAGLANSSIKFLIRFPQLPPFEKFLLRLESFGMNPVDWQAVVADIATFNSAGARVGATPVTVGKMYMDGWSTQSSVEMPSVATASHVPKPSVILSSIDFSALYAAGGNATRPASVPTVVVNRPNQNGAYEISFEGTNGAYIAGNNGGAPFLLGDWFAGISLTPIPNEDLKNFDGR